MSNCSRRKARPIASEEPDAEAEHGAAQRLWRDRRCGRRRRHQHAEVARGGRLEDPEVLQALCEDEVVGALLGRSLIGLELRLGRVRWPAGSAWRSARVRQRDERHRVGVGGRGRQPGARARGGDAHHVARRRRGRRPGVGDGLRRDREAGDRDALVAQHSSGSPRHVRARQHAPYAGQLEVARGGVGVRLPGQRIGEVQLLLVDEVGAGLILFGLARREEVGRARGHSDHQQDDPLAAPEHGQVVAKRDGSALAKFARRAGRSRLAGGRGNRLWGSLDPFDQSRRHDRPLGTHADSSRTRLPVQPRRSEGCRAGRTHGGPPSRCDPACERKLRASSATSQ